MAAFGREHPFAAPGVKSILTVEMPSRGVTVPGCLRPEWPWSRRSAFECIPPLAVRDLALSFQLISSFTEPQIVLGLHEPKALNQLKASSLYLFSHLLLTSAYMSKYPRAADAGNPDEINPDKLAVRA